MTITYITETGRELTAPDRAALDRGWGYYNDRDNSKADMIGYCASHGINLIGDDNTLAADWAYVVAYTYATHDGAKDLEFSLKDGKHIITVKVPKELVGVPLRLADANGKVWYGHVDKNCISVLKTA